MSNQPQTPPVSPTIQLILWILAAVGVPSAALTWANDQLPNNPWTLLSLAVAWVVLVAAARIVTQIWQGQEGRFVKSVEKRLNRANPFYRRRYLRHVVGRNRNFDVKGLTTQSTYNLELRRVFVDLAIAPRSSAFSSADPIRQVPPELRGQHSIWEYLRNPQLQHLAIVGPPGSGKTTLLKFMALALALPQFKHRQAASIKKLPILLYLRNHSGAISKDEPYSLVDAVEKSLAPYEDVTPSDDWFAAQLRDGKCLVLLDGLDEVADEELRKKVSAWVEQQMIAYPDNRFLVTSRPHGYQSAPLSGVTVLEVQPFSQKQVERFVHNWYIANEVMASQKDDRDVEIDAREGAEDLLARLRNTLTLAELAVNPLLLTMIANVHRYRSSLPGRRVELYDEVYEVFLGKRRQSIGIADELTPAQKQRVLQPLAFYMMQQETRKIKLAEAEPVVAGPLSLVYAERDKLSTPDFFKLIEASSGLLLEREVGEYSFAHLAFQEYLAAVHVLEEQQETVLLDQLDQSWWHETILLYAAQTDASNIIERCLALEPSPIDALLLALDCVDEAREVQPELRERLTRLLSEDVEAPEQARLVGEVLLARRLRKMMRVDEDLYIDSTYVTHVEYQLFLDEKRAEGKHLQPDHWRGNRFPQGQGANPIVGIRFEDVLEFLSWLSQRADDGWAFRLPKQGELDNLNSEFKIEIGYWFSTNRGAKFKNPITTELHQFVNWPTNLLDSDVIKLMCRIISRALDISLDVEENPNIAGASEVVRYLRLAHQFAGSVAFCLRHTFLPRTLAKAVMFADELIHLLEIDINSDISSNIKRARRTNNVLVSTLDIALEQVYQIAEMENVQNFSISNSLLHIPILEFIAISTFTYTVDSTYKSMSPFNRFFNPLDPSYFLSPGYDIQHDLTAQLAKLNYEEARIPNVRQMIERALDRSLSYKKRAEASLYTRLTILRVLNILQQEFDTSKVPLGEILRRDTVFKTLSGLYFKYQELYACFAILEARATRDVLPFEGIRIVRERVKSEVETVEAT